MCFPIDVTVVWISCYAAYPLSYRSVDKAAMDEIIGLNEILLIERLR